MSGYRPLDRSRKKLRGLSPFKGRKQKTKVRKDPRFQSRYITEYDLRQNEPIVFNKENEDRLSKVQYLVRGLGQRHWIKLHKQMTKMMYDKAFIHQMKMSFYKFKFMCSIDPTNSKDILWVFKNFLTLEGQKTYKEIRDYCMDTSTSHAINRYGNMGKDNNKNFRLICYFENSSWGFQIPMKSFPLISFSKDRMFLAFEKVPDFDSKLFREKVVGYLTRLELKELFVPPPDILHKTGNSLYNDDGDIKKDFERSKNHDSGFIYQEFMAQPLTPRQVWLPGKGIKNNNIFWMTIGRQFLNVDKVYPRQDRSNLEFLKDLRDCMRFDISGFGFQYLRQLLKIVVECICELYPCSVLDEMSQTFFNIMDDVYVDVGGERLRPPRGIGLGYYEDLKTIGIMALLYEFHPYSIYGDQGLVHPDFYIDLVMRLSDFGFMFISNDKIQVYSSTATSRFVLKWAGYSYDGQHNVVYKPSEVSDPLIGCFFQAEHWRRKNSLYSFAQNGISYYKRIEKRLIRLYDLYFGNEFTEGDNSLSFLDVGISLKGPLIYGESQLYKLSHMRVPYEDSLFQPAFVTPFKKVSQKVYPNGIARDFSKKRYKTFKYSPLIDNSVYFYTKPRISLNEVYKPPARVIPEWADLLYMFIYSASTGSFTYDLSPEQMDTAIQLYSLCSDPLKAYVSGGIKIYDVYHRATFPTSEWLRALDGLKQISKRSCDYIQVASLPVSMFWHDDPLYSNTDLTITTKKRKLKDSRSNEEYAVSSEFYNIVLDQLRRKEVQGKVVNAADLFHFQEQVNEIDCQQLEEFNVDDVDDYFDNEIDYLDGIE